MSSLREIKAAMPAEFVATFRDTAESLGMTPRQLAVTCITLGYKSLSHINEGPHSLPSEPPPVSSDEIAEKAAGSRVAEGDRAKRSMLLTLRAAFGAHLALVKISLGSSLQENFKKKAEPFPALP